MIRPPIGTFRGAFAHSSRLYVTRAAAPSHTESPASRSGSSVVRSSPRGHHAPSTYPVMGAFRFKRSRGLFSGPDRRRLEAPRRSRGAIGTIPSELGWAHFARIGDDTISDGRVRHTTDTSYSTPVGSRNRQVDRLAGGVVNGGRRDTQGHS